MQARYKDLLKRLYFHLIFLILALYIIFSSFDMTLNGQLELVTMSFMIILIIVLVRMYPKNRMDTVIVTPKDKKWMEYTSYTFTGLFLLQYIMIGSTWSSFRGYIGVIMLMTNILTIYIIYKIIKK